MIRILAIVSGGIGLAIKLAALHAQTVLPSPQGIFTLGLDVAFNAAIARAWPIGAALLAAGFVVLAFKPRI